MLMAGLIGCGETSPETLVDELRVLASVSSPPEVVPGEPFQFESYAFNPDEEPLESLTWVCTNFGEGCLEAAGGGLSLYTTELSGLAPTWERSLSVSPGLAPRLEETGPITATQLWTLTCVEGRCPVIENAQGLDGLTEWPEELHSDLVNPLEWMADLPMTGVTLAYQLLTTSVSDAPHANPSLEPDPENPTELARGKQFELSFELAGDFTDEAQLYNYATGGGFMSLNTFVNDDEYVTVKGTAPESGDEVRIWVVLVDGVGGNQVWTAELPVI